MFALIQGTDDTIMKFIQDAFRSPAMDTIMKLVTFLGDSGLIWIIFAVVMIISKKYRKYGIMMAVSLSIMLVCNNRCV